MQEEEEKGRASFFTLISQQGRRFALLRSPNCGKVLVGRVGSQACKNGQCSAIAARRLLYSATTSCSACCHLLRSSKTLITLQTRESPALVHRLLDSPHD